MTGMGVSDLIFILAMVAIFASGVFIGWRLRTEDYRLDDILAEIDREAEESRIDPTRIPWSRRDRWL